MRKIYLTIAASGLASQTMAQPADHTITRLINDPLFPVYLTGMAVIVLLVLVLIVALYVIRVLNFLTRETPGYSTASPTKEPITRWWQKFFDKINGSVPLAEEKDIEMDHSYDGIRELDNHLPPWWKWLFYGSIVWSVIYLIMFHVTSSMPLSREEYTVELALAEEQMRQYRSSQPQSAVDENMLEYTNDAVLIEKGKAIFQNNNCAGCHRSDGGGNSIGPNLADEYWLHGGDVKNVFLTIKNGVVEKGMPAWGKSMSAGDVRNVTFFIMSLLGTNPANAKAPQGEVFKTVSIKSDSAKAPSGL